jgi:tetratricopeptide (TPR) repeat protein
MKETLVVLVVCLACSGQTASHADAHHHEDLTAEQLGTVHFPTSCTESVQQGFERGVALLHSFWYEEAQKQFEQVATEDPHCAMAHWGLAMSYWHQLWNHPDKATIKRGRAEVNRAKALHSHNDREWGYISAVDAFYGGKKERTYQDRAVAYSKAMEVAYRRHPEDREAAAFYALSLLASVPDHDTTYSNQKKAAAILEKLFAEEPDHPGVAHYLIHSYDTPQMAELGLPAAERYAKIAPASPHALHMPSHIFARLGMWQDDINSNLASIAATRKTAAMHMGGEGHEFHAMDFLEYAYLQCGREADARHLIEEVKTMPPMKDMYGLGFDPRVWALVNFPARYVVELHRWNDAAALEAVPEAETDDSAATYWARGIGHARSGHADETRQDLASLDSIHRNLVREKKPLAAEVVEQDRQEVAAWLAHAEGRNDEAIATFRQIAEKQESEGDEPLAIPAREMLADLLVELNRPQEALTEYQADLKFNPNRFDGLAGAAHAAEVAGKKEEANSYSAQLVKICAGSSSDRPELLHAKQLLAYRATDPKIAETHNLQ